MIEEHFGSNKSVSFSSQQASITCTLELLGSSVRQLPVVFPVIAPPDTASAVLRAGAVPILLDVNPNTLQLSTSLVSEFLKDLGSAIFILTHLHPSIELDLELLDLLKDHPTIIDKRYHCPREIKSTTGSFDIYDLSVIDKGSLLFHEYPKQIQDLKLIRSGPVGHSSHMSNAQDANIADYYISTGYNSSKDLCVRNYNIILNKLINKDVHIYVLEDDDYKDKLIIKSDKAKVIAANIHPDAISEVGMVPLYKVPDIKRRYKEQPEYPGARALEDKILIINMYSINNERQANIIADKIIEVT